MSRTNEDDRFGRLSKEYDRWIGWSERLTKEMPFLLKTLDSHRRILDVGTGTGIHALALADAGYQVTAIDNSEAMLDKARTQEGAGKVEWIEADISDPESLAGRRYDAILALGNVILALGERETIDAALTRMLEILEPGGLFVFQLLNVAKIRESGRLVVKSSGDGEEEKVWIRHHHAAASELYFHSYVLERVDGDWKIELESGQLQEMTPELLQTRLGSHFESIELFEGLTGKPFDPQTSDALGIVLKRKKG